MSQDLSLPEAQRSPAPTPVLNVPEKFSRPLEHYERLMEKFTGSKPRKSPLAAWEKFMALPLEKRQMVADGWAMQANFIQQSLSQGLAFQDELGLLKQAMDHLKLMGDFSLLSKIESEDLVEIISPDLLQVYCSFSYFSLCNYSILELSSYPFFELYERSSWVMQQLMENAGKVLKGENNIVSLGHLPEYSIIELLTEQKTVFSMRVKYFIRVVSSVTGASYIVSVKRVKALATCPSTAMAYI
jgi:hypothetical protein